MDTFNETTVYSGKIFEIVQQKRKINGKEFVFEIARRAPGTRLIIIRNDKMLITREYRTELNGYDHRLPGGKVFDTLKEYHASFKVGRDILKEAIKAAKKECLQETGLLPKKITPYITTNAGATVVWDLFYFIIDDFEEHKQSLEDGEDITISWKNFSEVKELCISNKIREDRTVGVLLRFLEGLKIH